MRTPPKSEVFLADCMEVMARYPDNHFNLAIVDPPYGLGVENGAGRRIDAFTNYPQNKQWDQLRPSKEYFEELFRVSKNRIIWGANYFTEFLPPTKNWIVWDKAQPLGISLSMHELAYCDAKGQAPIFKVTNGSNANRCTIKSQSTNYQRIHPTQKPVKLYELCLSHFANQGDKILDTHLGSGSSRIAAHRLGFDFVGCEIDEDYFDAAELRFKRETRQSQMF